MASAFIICEDLIDNGCVMILGDNIYYGSGFSDILIKATKKNNGATILGYYVNDPNRFGIITFDKTGKAVNIEEKPVNPRSNYAVTGLYFYDNRCVEFAKSLKPSARGELEISDLNQLYMDEGDMEVYLLEREFVWIDAGTVDSLVEASVFVSTVEKQHGLKVSAVEEVAFRMGYINKCGFERLVQEYGKSPYGEYLMKILKEGLQ